MSKSIPVAELAANLDALLDEVAQKQEEVVVTKDGRAVARVVPIADEMRGPMYGTIRFLDDIVESTETWDCDRPWHSRDALHGSVTVLGDIVEPLDEQSGGNR